MISCHDYDSSPLCFKRAYWLGCCHGSIFGGSAWYASAYAVLIAHMVLERFPMLREVA
jgi:hypothetical protein